jgi:endonuclease/exonuclease/phosphatase family metal-dependent hydrolase
MSEPIRAGTANLARLMAETETRAAVIIAELNSMNLDILGLQEAEEWIEWELDQRLAGDWTVVSDHKNCPALVRADRFEKVAWHGQSAIEIVMPGSVRNRYGSSALLKRKSDGVVFVFATIHPSNAGESSNSAQDRIQQAESCWQHLVRWGVTDFPILLVGDMNAKEMPPAGLPGVFVSHGMTDVLHELGQPARIDRAFLKGFTALSASVNEVAASVSDHDFGVFVVVPGAAATIPIVRTVTMYVRKKSDPVWKKPPYELTARNSRGEFIDGQTAKDAKGDPLPARIRKPGYKVVGTVVDFMGEKFVKTQHGSRYKMRYLTSVKP